MPPQNFAAFVYILLDIIDRVVPFLIGLAALFFLFGVLKIFLAGGSEKALSEGKQVMLYGVIGLFVMLSVWGLVNLLYATFFDAGVSSFGWQGAPPPGTGSSFLHLFEP